MQPETARVAPALVQPPAPGFDDAAQIARRLEENVKRVMVGKADAIRFALIPLLCRGHLLVEDVPGIGKTTLAKAVARSVAGEFKRIQFTPDLLPLDVTGASMFNQKTQEFEFKRGPVFANVVLADEINRATPRTQSAMLECMEESQVTCDGHTWKLPEVFFVVATLNPGEQTGTFPLPETQLDRFALRIRLGYPTEAEEVQIFDRQAQGHPVETLEPVASLEDVRTMRAAVQKVFVHESVKQYCAKLVRATRTHPDVALGAGPRGTLSLIRSAQALSFLSNQAFVTPDSVKRLAPGVLGHRLVMKPHAALRGAADEAVLKDILAKTEVPIAEK